MTPTRRREAARRWLEEARERLDHARNYQGGSRRILCEQAHYATEFAIKSVIIARGRRFPTVHDIGLLLNTAEEAGETIPGDVETASSLTTYAGEGRYGFTAVPLGPYENGPGTPCAGMMGLVKPTGKHRGNQARGPQ